MPMPGLSVKSFAELIHLPSYAQSQVLYQQKYPKRQPAMYMAPYYRPALTLIHRYYSRGNNLAVLPTKPEDIRATGHKQANNFRAIASFRASKQTGRLLVPRTVQTVRRSFGAVECRVTPELYATDGGRSKYIFYNCKADDPEIEVIRTTLELAFLVLSDNHNNCSLGDFEYVCLHSNGQHSWKGQPRKSTMKRAVATATMVNAVWPSL